MPKFFVTSDIHSFMNPLKRALDEKGFDPTNKDHWLVVCGDCYDRGDDSELVLNYLMSLERKILIRGNHELLLRDLCERGFPYRHDFHNGTTMTVYDLGDAGAGNDFEKCCEVTQNKLREYNNLLVNYFETQNYIFVHSWIVVNKVGIDTYEYREDWRNSSDEEWGQIMWTNPFWRAQDGLNKTGKTIVFGHWHCSTGHAMDKKYEIDEFGKDAIWEPYINKEQGIIGIDRCVSYTNEVNVIVLEDEFLDD